METEEKQVTPQKKLRIVPVLGRILVHKIAQLEDATKKGLILAQPQHRVPADAGHVIDFDAEVEQDLPELRKGDIVVFNRGAGLDLEEVIRLPYAALKVNEVVVVLKKDDTPEDDGFEPGDDAGDGL